MDTTLSSSSTPVSVKEVYNEARTMCIIGSSLHLSHIWSRVRVVKKVAQLVFTEETGNSHPQGMMQLLVC